LVVGSPIAGRTQVETEALIGIFINTLVLRTDLSGDPSFRELLSRVREMTLAAYVHQELPFEKLVELLKPEREPGYTPLFQVIFNLENIPEKMVETSSLGLEELNLEHDVALFDLNLELVEQAGRLTCFFKYNLDLFEPATIERMAGHFQTLLAGIAANPERAISELPLLTDVEQYQLLATWNETLTDFPREKGIHQLFETQVERTPDAVAVVFGHKQLTYRQLNNRANQLAHYLRNYGVRSEMLVGICLERSIEMIVGLLGILKAGGAYVPLDPEYPQDRLAFMLEELNQTGSMVLLTQAQMAERVPEFGGRVIQLDADWEAIGRESQANPEHEDDAEKLAYVMYTSGSTGRPKGVCIPHRAISRLVFNTNYIKLEADDVVAQASNASFDAATFEIWGALLHGARLVGLSKDVLLSPHEFARQLQAHNISVLFLTTALFNQLAREAPGAFRPIRHLLFGGEAADPRWVKAVLQHDPPRRLLHVYGPTECTTFATWHLVEAVPEGATTIPIGRPISNTQIYLLDKHLRPVPIGIPGELYIGGDGLASGYLNRPELTQEKFIPNPIKINEELRIKNDEAYLNESHSSSLALHSSLIYKTGDLARYLPNGDIEFLGRIDQQVKIRGFRIELEEIEVVLGQHPQILESVVVVREDSPGGPSTSLPTDKRLVAYVVSNQASVSVNELRSFLKKKLPDYMIPSAFVMLKALPLTANGKVDRRALPAPDTARADLASPFAAPESFVEVILAGIWAELLGLERVGVHDNFFELGGHSLLAAQVLSRLQAIMQVDLPLRCLFESPTIRGLAEQLDLISPAKPEMPLKPVAQDRPLPLSFAQQRLWLLDQLEPGNPAYNISTVYRLRGPLDVAALEQSFNEIVRRHGTLRTSFTRLDDRPVQIIAPSLTLPLPVIDLTGSSGAEQKAQVEQMLRREEHQRFDLRRAPLLRTTLLRLGQEEHLLILVIHHIVSDGWSMNILYRELSTFYTLFCRGEAAPPAELPVQYADYAIWQQDWLQGEVLERQLGYWKQQLKDAPFDLTLPADRPRPPIQTFRGEQQQTLLSKALSDALRELSQQEGVSLFMTLLAAFKILLHRHTGQDDIVVGTPIANRRRVEIENLIGLFLNNLVLRTDHSGQPTFRQMLKRVSRVALEAYDHEELPFEKLVEELQSVRDLSRSPLFQVFFNMFNFTVHPVELAGLAVEPLPSSRIESKFDLTLYVAVQGEIFNLTLVYNADLFNQARMAELLAQYEGLLEQIVVDPDKPIAHYSLVTPGSRRLLPDPTRLLPEPAYELLPQAFMSWARRSPAQPALSQDNQVWCYQELAQAARSLARHLLAEGLERGEVTVVCGPRSFGLIAGMLGVFLSGGVLLTLDQLLPHRRQQVMLQAARARRLIYIGSQQPGDAWLWDSMNVIRVDPQTGQRVDLVQIGSPDGIELPELTPDAPAYVFFTSGTTGTPKGILGCHKGLAHFLTWQRQTFEVGPRNRSAQLTGLSFDVVLRDIFLPLTSGATLCLPPAGVPLEPNQVLPWLEQEGISLLHTVPSLMQAWLSEPPPANLSLRNLRWLFSAGEPLTGTLARRWRAAFPEAGNIVNIYGPTETTLAKFYYILPETDLTPGIQPVGRSLPETQALVLSKDRQLCGIGEPGEVVIRTPFRSLGYLNAPEENETRFAKNPFRDDAQDLVYYTGDRGCYRPDGLLDIMGRLDDQIKIRGIRIEPGEVGAVLSQHPQVDQAVVVAWGDKAGEKKLAAYVVPDRAQAPAVTDLSHFLRQRLPEAMLPSGYVLLASLPLTANGKIDRRALPAPDWERPNGQETFVAARNVVEETLAGIWAEILKLERVGIHDNFFEVGGHSLLATQVVSRICKSCQVELPLRRFFEKPTIAELAKIIEEIRGIETQLQRPVITSHSRERYRAKRSLT
jgi:amino acid adenylation domain-containing protein